jgi:glycosyltransferase involved in cell wall biosynthesis
VSATRAPVVSIVTLTCNHGVRLAECLDSVRRQTYEDWEHVVLDDGSTDGSVDAVELAADPRVRVVRQSRRGVEGIPGNYCRALALARGRRIAFLDGDDQWTPRALESGLAALEDPEAVLAWGDTELFGARTGRKLSPGVLARHPLPQLDNAPVGAAARAFVDPLVTMPFSMNATLLRREVLDRIGGLQVRPGLPVVDHPTLLRLTLEGRFRHTGVVAARHRIEHSTVSHVETSRIDLGVYRDIRAFRRRYGRRVPIAPAEWREVEAGWRRRLARRSNGNAVVRLARSGRWGAAARHALWLGQAPWLWRHELPRLGRMLLGRQAR